MSSPLAESKVLASHSGDDVCGDSDVVDDDGDDGATLLARTCVVTMWVCVV